MKTAELREIAEIYEAFERHKIDRSEMWKQIDDILTTWKEDICKKQLVDFCIFLVRYQYSEPQHWNIKDLVELFLTAQKG